MYTYKHSNQDKNDTLINIIRDLNPDPRLGVEIGVRDGTLSKRLLETFQGLYLFLIDFYQPYQDVHDYFTKETQKQLKETMLLNLTDYPERFRLLETKSSEADIDVSPDCDFIFVDASHTYNDVLKDLFLYEHKLRKNGIFCGHDYDMFPVKKAVREFAKLRNKKIVHVPYPSDIWIYQ